MIIFESLKLTESHARAHVTFFEIHKLVYLGKCHMAGTGQQEKVEVLAAYTQRGATLKQVL